MKRILFYTILIAVIILNSMSFDSVFADDLQDFELAIGGFNYNPNSCELSVDASVSPSSSSVEAMLILGVYRFGELIGIDISDSDVLSADSPQRASVTLENTNSITAKAMVLNSFGDITPLVPYKECTDIFSAIEYEDVTKENTRILHYHNFEDYPYNYHEMVTTWPLEKIANGHSIEVKQEEYGNCYLSMDTVNGVNASFYTIISCGGLQQTVIEMDIRPLTLSGISLELYDSDKNFITLASMSNGSNILYSNGREVGTLDKDNWTRLKILIDNNSKLINFYTGGLNTGKDIPMASSMLSDLLSVRVWAGKGNSQNTLMLDNIIAYSGNALYDFSQVLMGTIDESMVTYNHNNLGVEELLTSYNAINPASGKLYTGSLQKLAETPYYENGKLMISIEDAKKLIPNNIQNSDEDFVSLEDYALQNGKKLTITKTSTILIGDKEAVLSDKMIKQINAYMTYDRPDGTQLQSDFASSSHPRLTINSQKLQEIKSLYESGEDEYIAAWGKRIISFADSVISTSVQPYVEPSDDGGRLLVPAKTIKERIQKLALAYHLTGDDDYVTRAWLEIENACNFPNWHQQIHDLDSSTMASAIAYGYDWLYDKWDKETQLPLMENAIYQNQLNQAYECYHGFRPYSWAVQTNNWNACCNGYTALAAMAIYESNPPLCSDIISNAIKNSELALIDFYPDGAWKEGPGYWGGTVEPYAEMFSTIKNTFGTYYNLHNTACLDITADYMAAASGPVAVNNFNDANMTAGATVPAMFWFSNVYNKPDLSGLRLKELDSGKVNFEVLDICWYDSELAQTDVSLPLDSYFEGVELVSLRGSHTDPDTSYISFHSGNNIDAWAHSHIDSGTFVLDMLGERFAVDPGSHYYYVTGHGNPSYSQPKAGVINRWSYYQHIPEGHNTLIINPDGTLGQNIVTRDKITSFEAGEDSAFAITELSSAYSGYAQRVRRGIMLSHNRKIVTVRDEIELNSGENEIYWFMHTSINNNIEYLDSNTVIMNQNGKRVKLEFVTNADTASIYETEPTQMKLTPSPEQVSITSLKKLAIKLSGKGSVYLQVNFIPLDGSSDDINVNNTSLDNWTLS